MREDPLSTTRLVGVPEPVTVRVPAKINLHLAVGAARPDGFHELITVFHAISLYDEITAIPANNLTVSLQGEETDGVPLGEDNLACRAARAVAGRAGVEPAVHLDLRKGIPVAGGLAGGSADAAAALVACDALWGTELGREELVELAAELGREELVELAAELGSDVAFALTGGTALGTGRGERLTPVLAAGHWHWVLAVADGGLSTPEVYAELDRLRPEAPEPSTPDGLINALRAHDPVRLGELLANDLQPAAQSLRPALAKTLRVGMDLGALGGIVSGSGPTCAFLVRSHDRAVRLAASLAGAGVCRTVRIAHGPVAGARIVEDGADR